VNVLILKELVVTEIVFVNVMELIVDLIQVGRKLQMGRQVGDGFINEPGDEAARNKRREELEKKLDPRDHQYISIIFGGNRIEIPLKEFIKAHGSPKDYQPSELRKFVLDMWMRKNLG